MNAVSMVWRKRRRYRLATIVSYTCVIVGVVFITGNLIMLREGFVQLYLTAFGGRPSIPRQHLHDTRMNSLSHNRWSLSRNYYPLPKEDLPMIVLPVTALEAELRLRKLMDKDNFVGSGSRVASGSKPPNDPSSDDLKYLHGGQVVIGSSADGVQVVAVSSRDLRQALQITSDCAALNNMTDGTVVGSGWTKVVYSTNFLGKQVAMKTIDLNGHDVVTCMKENAEKGIANCYERAAHKLMKEILLLRSLNHPHLIQVLSHCVPNILYNGRHNSKISMVTELGDSIDIIKLLSLSWEDRLRICYGLSKLLHYLAHSPHGSLLLKDFRRQQFVLIGGDLKLTDMDDVEFTEKTCHMDADCRQHHSSVNITISAPCIAQRCFGLNEKTNIFNAARQFVSFLLPHGAHGRLRPALDSLVHHFSKATKTSKELLSDMTGIVDAFSSGSYLNRSRHDVMSYKKINSADLPGGHDYCCNNCMDGALCKASVADEIEAVEICDSDAQCQAFVKTGTRSWTGRLEVIFKNSLGTVSRSPGKMLFIKPQPRVVH